MKVALSIALLGLFAIAALARTDIPRKEFKFTPGKIQTYEYRGRLVNGIPKLANQYSGLQVECKVVIQPQDDQQVVMKLEDIRVGELPHNHNVEHYERIDSDKFDVVYNDNKELTEEYQRELVKPIRFTYINGKVHGFEADTNELEWSINMKKSILSLFQLDLTPSKIIKSSTLRRIQNQAIRYVESNDVDSFTGDRRQQQQQQQWSPEEVISQSGELPLVYPIYEESYQGICETQYQVDSIDNVDQQQLTNSDFIQVLNVTKTINFKNCLTDPSVAYDQHTYGGKTASQVSWQKSWIQQQRQSQYNAIPEEIKSRYSNVFTSTGAKDNVAGPQPVDRYSFIKYNITQIPQSGLSVIEGVLAEGKIKYQADGDELVSISHQKLKLLYVQNDNQYQSSSDASPIVKFQQIQGQTQVYTTIQCEMSQLKMKYYQDIMRQASSKLGQQQQQQRQQQSGKIVPPFANSASWYSLIADEDEIRYSSPEQLAKQLDQLLEELADDVQSDIVDQDTKKAGHRVVQIVHIVANLPKWQLAEIYEQLTQRVAATHSNQWDITSKDDTQIKYKLMRKLFLDSLPLSGNKQAIQLIVELIENKRLSSAWEAKELVEAVPQNLRYPDKEVIDAFVRLTQSPHVRDHQNLKMSASIACAKMIASAYTRSKDLSFKSTTYEKRLPVHLREDAAARIIADEADPRHTSAQIGADYSVDVESQLISEQDIIKYVNIFKGMLEKSRNYHDRVTYIETLAHMKVAQVLPVFQPYISGGISLNQCVNSKSYDDELTMSQHQRNHYRQTMASMMVSQSADTIIGSKSWSEKEGKDAEECNFLRTIAIYACAHIARAHPSDVLPLVLPVFDNTYEPYQLRIAAFTIALLGDIDEPTLERIATQMWREPSKQVASFVVGTLDTVANMTEPKMAKVAYVARKAVDSMPKEYLNTWRYSWLAGGDHYNNEVEQAISWQAELVKSNVSRVPRAGYLAYGRSHGPAAQNYDNKIELGWTAKGLEQFMEEYLAEEEGSILATLFQQLFASSGDIEKYYQDALYYTVKQQQQRTPRYVSSLDKKQRFGRSLNGDESEKSFGNTKQQHQRHSWQSNDEEPKLALFAKVFDQTSYLAMDKQQMMKVAKDLDDYITEMGKEILSGGKFTYTRMIMPASMWQMVPSQAGLPVFITHRKPIIVSIKIDAASQKASSQTSGPNYNKQTRWTSPMSAQMSQQFGGLDTLSVYVEPKIMHSSLRFMFTVDQAKKTAYGVQTEKSNQVILPMAMSVAYSQPRQLLSFALAPIFLKNQQQQQQQQQQQANQFWSIEVAKTFVGDLTLIHKQQQSEPTITWLGDEKMIRSRSTDNIRSPANVADLNEVATFEKAYNQKWLGLDLVVKGATDDFEFDWSFDMENKNQHAASGPFAHYLHIIDELITRPCKYHEVYAYLRPDQAHKQPVYKFEWALQKPLRSTGSSKYQTAIRHSQQQQVAEQQWRSRDGAQISNQQQQQQQPAQLKHTAVWRDEQEDKICFSTKPVKKCPKGTQTVETVVVETPFACMSANELPTWKRWVEEAQDKVLHPMEEMKVTFVRPYTQARMCAVY